MGPAGGVVGMAQTVRESRLRSADWVRHGGTSTGMSHVDYASRTAAPPISKAPNRSFPGIAARLRPPATAARTLYL